MYDPSPITVDVRILAPDALLQAGLRRLANNAGLHVLETGDAAALTLRTPGSAGASSDVEVEVDQEAVVIRVRQNPESATWTAVSALVAAVFEHEHGD